jgi:catechol 2,3-dioxygenase-like lactoylglutathione lyase family enzyme
MTRIVRALLIASLVLAPARAFAQLADGPVVYGHHHLNVTSIDAHKKFWADTLGGTVVKIGTDNREVIKVPGVWIFFRMQAPTAGSKGSTADHIAFSVPNLQATLDKVRANGFRVATAEESPASYNVKGDIATPAPGTLLGFAFGPDNVKVELLEVKNQSEPLKLHHIHFMADQNNAMRDWYVKTFGATAAGGAPNAPFVTANLPGVRLTFSPATPAPAATAGRAYDHIGFEVKNLAGFMKTLEAQGITPSQPLRHNDVLGIDLAFITDPWGTNIELTDGLSKLR